MRDFRSYWYTNGVRYIYVQGTTALTSSYTPASYGDAYVFDSGDDPTGPDWAHASIEVGWGAGYDQVAQHSIGEIIDWRKWYYTRSSYERYFFTRSGHGVRIITP